jgi:hypothetical protein
MGSAIFASFKRMTVFAIGNQYHKPPFPSRTQSREITGDSCFGDLRTGFRNEPALPEFQFPKKPGIHRVEVYSEEKSRIEEKRKLRLEFSL